MRAIPLLLIAAACAAAPPAEPDELARRIATHVEEGDARAAERLFERADSPDVRERLYPLLYGRARERYEADDTAGAADLLRFMRTAYPGSDAVAEALLYSLFLERAADPAAAREGAPLGQELDRALADVRAEDATPPPWVDLVEVQRAIDAGHPERAREAYRRFVDTWEGEPAELETYVADLGRYLSGAGAPERRP